jgi:ferrous iron transport protein A
MKGNGVTHMMPLIFAKEGETVTIRRISGKDDIRQHLAELGFVVDTPVLIVSHMAGNLIVQVKGSRVALDRSMAQKIYF